MLKYWGWKDDKNIYFMLAPCWIRFNAVFGSKHFDVDVDSSGRFRVWDDLDGLYMLTVSEGPKLLATLAVSFSATRNPRGEPTTAKLTIDLPARPVDVMRAEKP